MKQLSQKVALVTGAGSGIGKAIAKLFAEQGAKVMLTDIHQSNIEAVAAEIRANGGMVACIAADISVKGDVQLVMKYVHNTFGTLDILVNNAGVMDNFTPVTDVTDELWEKVIGTNLNVVFLPAVKLYLFSWKAAPVQLLILHPSAASREAGPVPLIQHPSMQ